MLTLEQVRTLVEDTAAALRIPIQVVGATAGGHDSDYVEVFLSIAECTHEPCRLVVGLDRSGSDSDVRRAVEARLREHPDLHR
jgi:hypothetical protein